jgi:CheY-like chemotaxis protein
MADVLVVEDHVDSADAIATALRRAGHVVRHALDGHRALAMLTRQRPDLIVLDVRLPVMDGIGFMDVLRSYLGWQDIPVIVVSAAGDAEIDRVQDFGIAHVFRKSNFQLNDFVEKVNESLDRHSAV